MYTPIISISNMIQIIVNNEPITIPGPMSVDQLMQTVPVPPNYLAVEINGTVIPHESHHSTTVSAGDIIEVVTLVGGG